METTSILSKSEACMMGASTEAPCPYPATEPVPRWSDDAPRLCAFHAATEPLVEECDALSLALELLKEFEARAREYDNGPLLGLISRGRAEFTERLELAERVVEDLVAAEQRLFRR